MFQHNEITKGATAWKCGFGFLKKKIERGVHLSTVSLGIRKTGFGEDVLINFISLAFQNQTRKYESAWKIVNCCINESFT